MTTTRAVVRVEGRVQGVGFRWWVRRQAEHLGVVGWAHNLPDGRVEVDAQGARDAVDALVALLTERPSRNGRPGEVDSWLVERRDREPGRDRFTTG